jgi:streptogramin lyase
MRLAAAFCLLVVLTGCAVSPTAAPVPERGLSIRGNALGGQQPIAGAHVYLFAANTTGYGQPSVSLLNPSSTGFSDSLGAYVLTDTNGGFTITDDYTCTAGTQVYLYILGGNPGAGVNSAAGLLAILGQCPASGNFAAAIPFVTVNEASTIAAAYAMAGFATDATHVSSSGTPLAQTGLANAFANAASLVNISSGVALTTTPAGNGTVPQARINTLANILAACVNSTGPSSAGCSTLLSHALSGGSTGTAPTDTATAAINIAHNPSSNIGALFALLVANGPFQPTLTVQPNDLILALNFTGSSISNPGSIAIDGYGNVWTVNTINLSSGPLTVTKLSNSGAVLSGISGYVVGITTTNLPGSLAIDPGGNAWITSWNDIYKVTSSGSLTAYPVSESYDYRSIAIDASGNVWANTSQLSPSGTNPLLVKLAADGSDLHFNNVASAGGLGLACDASGNIWTTSFSNVIGRSLATSSNINVVSGIQGPSSPTGIVIDAAGNPWTATQGSNKLIKYSYDASTHSYLPSSYTGGGLGYPEALAIDGSGSIWITNVQTNISTGQTYNVSHFGNDGTAISPSTGFTNNNFNFPTGIATDPSGNVWIANANGNSIVEFVGAATPVVTPISVSVRDNTLATRP